MFWSSYENEDYVSDDSSYENYSSEDEKSINEYEATNIKREERVKELEKDKIMKNKRLNDDKKHKEYLNIKTKLGLLPNSFGRRHDGKDDIKRNKKLFLKELREERKNLKKESNNL